MECGWRRGTKRGKGVCCFGHLHLILSEWIVSPHLVGSGLLPRGISSQKLTASDWLEFSHPYSTHIIAFPLFSFLERIASEDLPEKEIDGDPRCFYWDVETEWQG